MTNVISNTVSTFLESQFPEFIREGSPNFVAFMKAYYEWMETVELSPTSNSVIYNAKNLLNYKDIDSTTDAFVQYYVNDFLPYFPNDVVLDERKLIKVARQFYQKKGTPESIQFLFRVLYGKEADLYFPKANILKISDGKWTLPQALRLLLSANNANFPVEQLTQRLGVGSNSSASCIIESAKKLVDPNLGFEVVDVYISNISKPFDDLESLMVNYGIDANGNALIFEEKIIASLSNVVIDPNNRGLKYNKGDPVVLTGGLETNDPSAQKAIAIVGNVTTGSITSINVAFGGYAYRANPNTYVSFINAPGDANGAGAMAIVSSVDVANSIYVSINTDSIEFKANEPMNSSNLQFANVAGGGNANTPMANLFSFANLAFAPIRTMNVIQGGGGYSQVPNVAFEVVYNTDYSNSLALAADPNYLPSQQNIADLGMFAAVQVLSGGTGYSNTTDTIIPLGAIGERAGFDFVTDGTGAITKVIIKSRGQGYLTIPPLVLVNTSNLHLNASSYLVDSANNLLSTHTPPAGNGAVLLGVGFGQGAQITVGVNKIGQITDFIMSNRGFDYVEAPVVSLRVEDVIINYLGDNNLPLQDSAIYQGANLENAIFRANVDSYNTATGVLRLYNYRGAINVYQNLVMTLTTLQTINATVNTAVTGNVHIYGNGQARANAIFLNGLIQYPGFYLNTDGMLSSDQYIQDANTYQNYSYQIIVEKALADYKAMLLNIAHPAGTSMLGKFVIEINEVVQPKYDLVIRYVDVQTGTVNVTSTGNVYGTGTSFLTNQTQVGDMITFGTGSREFTKVITAVGNNGFLSLESNTFTFFGANANVANNSSILTVNTAHFSGNVLAGDGLVIELPNANVVRYNVTTVYDTQLLVDGLFDFGAPTANNLSFAFIPVINSSSFQITSSAFT